jgi:tRNA(His) guanylyltransferase
MDSDEFERRMRASEYFHSLRLLPGAWTVIRVDGRGFSRLTETGFEKPFDLRFQEYMRQTAKALLEDLHGIYTYTESDEISVLFRPDWDLFDRELEKLVSISASIASATFTHAYSSIVHFDSRVWLGANESQVVDYFRWRQMDAERCALNGWCHWTLRKAGKTPTEAMAALKKQSIAFKNELLFQHGINFNNLPIWQRRGTGLYWEEYEKVGYDPIRAIKVTSVRRRVKMDEELPMKDVYGAFIRNILDTVEVEEKDR